MDVLLRGLIIGFSIAAPVGPIGMLCIRRTLAGGLLTGFISGLGAATADAFYGSIAAFGLTFLVELFLTQQTLLRLIGGAFLIYLGVQTSRKKPTCKATQSRESNLLSAYLSAGFLTLTNPMTIITFTAIFASVNIGDINGKISTAAILVLGVFLGSPAWWLSLSTGIGLIRNRFNDQILTWINRLAGIVIIAFGILAIVNAETP